MIIFKKALPRRTFLRGAGAAIALPLLDAMIPALAQSGGAAEPIRRLGYFYIPMGMDPDPWVPKTVGKLDSFTPSLEALTPYLKDISVLSNMEIEAAHTTGNHASSNCAFLSCMKAKRTEGSDYYLGTTVDQIAAKVIGSETPFPSLELGTDILSQVGNCDNGYACVYQNSLAWSSPTTPLPTESDPRILFERLFGDGGTPEQRQAELATNASLLDAVMDDMSKYQQQLGSSDRVKVDEYLDTVREVERRIQMSQAQSDKAQLPELTRPTSVPEEWEEHVKLMIDLQTLALQADLTRVITFQLAREASTRTYPQIGVDEPHHPISHHGNDPVQLEKLAKINKYHVSLFAYMLESMKSVDEGNGSLLDNSTYLLGSGMGNPDIHNHKNLPIVVASGANSGIHGGRHIRYGDEQMPLANLHLTLLDSMGVHLENFADNSGRVDELFHSA
ncbi:MAG: DUF1552 domain-containing protein [Pseudomonadales bacterium]|nr:DUF1552 domain-containing protein [Pseudomonadales bacterium]